VTTNVRYTTSRDRSFTAFPGTCWWSPAARRQRCILPGHLFGTKARMDRTWLLLIYTVPAEHSRQRAFIWRRLDPCRVEWLESRSRGARAEEYADVAGEAERVLEHVAHETEHREFTFAELEKLEADLAKLKRWTEQVRGRDHFEAGPDEHLQTLLDRCENALGAFLDATASQEAGTAGP
jgi:hypothetical protein